MRLNGMLLKVMCRKLFCSYIISEDPVAERLIEWLSVVNWRWPWTRQSWILARWSSRMTKRLSWDSSSLPPQQTARCCQCMGIRLRRLQQTCLSVCSNILSKCNSGHGLTVSPICTTLYSSRMELRMRDCSLRRPGQGDRQLSSEK
jgi:hypothetical protein